MDVRSGFYCHSCEREINLSQDGYTCPNCENGFVEESSMFVNELTPSVNMGNSPSEDVAEEDEIDQDATGDSNSVQQQDNWTQTESRNPSPEPDLRDQLLVYFWERRVLYAAILERVGNTARPLSAQLRDEIPFIIMSNEDVQTKPICTICFEYFQIEELVRKLSCDHKFHENCIMPWLHQNDTCPNCRKCLADAEEEEVAENQPAQADAA